MNIFFNRETQYIKYLVQEIMVIFLYIHSGW